MSEWMHECYWCERPFRCVADTDSGNDVNADDTDCGCIQTHVAPDVATPSRLFCSWPCWDEHGDMLAVEIAHYYY